MTPFITDLPRGATPRHALARRWRICAGLSLALLLALTLCACGQKGDLYRPDQSAAQTKTQQSP